MNTKISVHKDKVDKKLKSIPYWEIPQSTKKELIIFIDKARLGQVSQGIKLTERTLSKYLSLLKKCLEIIDRQTLELKKEDIERFDKKITDEKLSSVVDYRRALKVFLNWRLGEEKAKKLSGWLDTRDKVKTPDYLKESEIEKLFKDCRSNQERFTIAVLFDSGARAEEFLNIRYEDIHIPDKNENFVRITLKEEYSKTKGRNISLYWKYSLNAVRDYLKERESEGIKSSQPVPTMTYDGMRAVLRRLGKRILKKSIYPHLFRHSSATYYATKLNRQELCYRYGWAFSSTMPDVYISRAGMESKQLDEKFKATELEILEKNIEKDKFNLSKMKEEIETREKEYYQMFSNLRKEIEVLKKAR